jgi:hypothetical protein
MNPGSEYDDFLLASMGEDRNGLPLNVLSALARLDIDPWEEAARLARLPLDAATLKLTSLITALPVGSSARANPETTAHRLVALLRPQPARETPSPGATRRTVVTQSRVVAFVFYYLVAMALLMAGQLITGPRDTRVEMEKALAPVAVTVLPLTVLPHSVE